MRKILLLLGLVAVILVSGCTTECTTGSGNIVSRNFTLSGFSGIDFEGVGNLYITQGAGQSVKISADENMIDLLGVDVANGKLRIYYENCFESMAPLDVYVTMEDVRELAGSGDVNVISNGISADTLRLSISGSGSFDLTLDARELNSIISGTGKSEFKGTAKVHKSVISGPADIRAFALSTEETVIEITGSGQAEVRASERLDASIAGSGTVFYMGSPIVSQTVTGTGKVERI